MSQSTTLKQNQQSSKLSAKSTPQVIIIGRFRFQIIGQTTKQWLPCLKQKNLRFCKWWTRRKSVWLRLIIPMYILCLLYPDRLRRIIIGRLCKCRFIGISMVVIRRSVWIREGFRWEAGRGPMAWLGGISLSWGFKIILKSLMIRRGWGWVSRLINLKSEKVILRQMFTIIYSQSHFWHWFRIRNNQILNLICLINHHNMGHKLN